MLTRVIKHKLGRAASQPSVLVASRSSSFFADAQDMPKELLREASRRSKEPAPPGRRLWNDRLAPAAASRLVDSRPPSAGPYYGAQSTLPRINRKSSRSPQYKQRSEKTLVEILADFSAKQEGYSPSREDYLEALRAAADYSARRQGTALATGLTVSRVDGEAEEKVLRAAEKAVSDTAPGKEGLGWKLALGFYEDARAAGFDLGIEGIDFLLHAASPHPHLLHSLLLHISDLKLQPSESTYRALLRPALTGQTIEQVVLLMHEMQVRDIKPASAQIKSAISVACAWRMPRLAVALVDIEERTALRPMESSVWLEILRCCAEEQFVDGVELAWQQLSSQKFYPEEGLILSVLATAGMWGKPDLATSALSYLPALQVRASEHHLAPLLEAFCHAGRVPEAISVLKTIRDSGLEPTSATAAPIVNVLAQSADILDEAFYQLEDTVAKGEMVDVTALNALVEASVRLKDLQRARATQAAAADLKVTPTIETYNLVLSACIEAKHRPLGDTLLSELTSSNPPLKPDAVTYERLIMLCLTQPTYEDAFYFLEQMKAAGITPRASTYENLIRKCARVRDPRWKVALEEMESLGYKPSGDLIRYCQTGGQDDPSRMRNARGEGGVRRTRDRMMNDKRRNFEAKGSTEGVKLRHSDRGDDEGSEGRARRASSSLATGTE